MRFLSLNNIKPSEKESVTEAKPADVLEKEQKLVPQTELQPVETAPPKDESTKFEENNKYIVKTLTMLGVPLVLRSEQNIVLEDEPKRDIKSLLEENEKLKYSLLKGGKQTIEEEELLLKTANFYHITGHSQKAADIYDYILKRNPTKMAALNNKGVVLDSSGEYENALQYFNEALNRVPENVHVLSNKGITLYKNEKYQQALECFDATLKIDASYINALTFKAHSLYRLRKNADALDCYNKIIRLDNNNAEALYNKACLCSLKGDEYGSTTSLEKAIRLDPSWKEAALQDNDLQRIRSNPRFRNIIK